MQDHRRRGKLRIDPHKPLDRDTATRLFLDLTLQRGNEIRSLLDLTTRHHPPASGNADKKNASAVVANTPDNRGDVRGVIGHDAQTLSQQRGPLAGRVFRNTPRGMGRPVATTISIAHGGKLTTGAILGAQPP